jgi:PASTA domain/Divergent InlB B-repeat domain
MGSRRIIIPVLLALTCALVFACTSLRSDSSLPPTPRVEMEFSEGAGEDPVARAGWFNRQRAYPADEIPAHALAQAVREARQLDSTAGKAGATELASAPPSLTWTPIGPKPINDIDGTTIWSVGRATAVVPVGNGTVAYAGAAGGGVWKTTDAGVHWTPVFDDAIGAGGTGLAIGSLAVDPTNTNIVYAGTGEANVSIDSYFGGGIFKSTNAGSTWTKVGGTVFDTCHVADLELRSGTILASAVRVGRWTRTCVGGVYRSTDGGANWTRTLTDDSDTDSPPIKPDGFPPVKTTGAFDAAPGVAGTWFATVHGDDPLHAGGNIFKSTDDGVSWSRLGNGLPTTGNGRTQIATAPTDRNRVYAVTSSTLQANYGNLKGIYASTNGGSTWTTLPTPTPEIEVCSFGSAGLGACINRLRIAVDPTDPAVVIFGAIAAFRSTDSGQTWTRTNIGHSDYTSFAFDSVGRTWVANDGGVFRRATDGSIENLNATLPITEFEWGIAGEADADGPVFGGTQDTTTVLRMPNGAWRAFSCSDGGAVAWRPSAPNTIVSACFTDLITRTTNGGASFDEDGWFDLKSKEDPGEFFNFHPPLVMDPSDGQRLYFASTRVWRTTDGASTWNPISPHFGLNAAYAVQALGVTTSQDVLYAGTNNGLLERTTNATSGTPTWTPTQANGLPNRTFTEIQTKPSDPGTAYVTASGFDPNGGSGHVFSTTDFGAHWTNISGNLPNAPVNAIEVDWRTSPATLYAATDVGVFWSQSGGLSWNNTSAGMPSLMAVDVKLDPVADKLLAATHGRGMYVAPVLPARTTRALGLTKSGAGAGTVTSAPAGIDCGSVCAYDFDTGTPITLTAVAAAGSVFAGWSGDCSGTGACQLTMSADHPVTAVFALTPKTLTLQKAGTGTGTVTSSPAGIACGSSCSYPFDHGTSVTLTASSGTGSTFEGWSGACSGLGPCTLTMTANQTATATFALVPFTLDVGKAGGGAGTVTSSPAGIDCGATCSQSFLYGSEVTLSAAAAAGSSFTGWTGACSGAGSCTVTMAGPRSVSAIFDTQKTLTVTKAGGGSGSITSAPGGIDCGATCTHAFAHGATVTLTAQAGSGSTFAGWSGACSGAGTCTLTLVQDRQATATFTANPPPPPPPARKCVVPNVKGKTLVKAKRSIRAARCAVGRVSKAYSRKRVGTVISQKPIPGTKRAVGSKVSLVVSKGRKKS